MSMSRWSIAASAVLMLAGCVESEPPGDPLTLAPPDGHSSREALDWPGRYRGLVPCADCEAIDTAITLREDGTYERALQYLGRENAPSVERGTFAWSPAGDRVILGEVADDGGALQYQVGEHVLFQLDRAGERITGALAERYQLAKAVADPRIEGVEWRLVQLEGAVIAVEGTRTVDLTLTDSRASGSAYCNRFTGPYDVLAGERLRLGPNFAGTRMGCANAALEARYLQMLPAVRTYRVESRGFQLQLSDEAGVVRAVFELSNSTS
ncbi:MAG: copper resistance protein NlpE N-terminal domain-containing protein [Pseudomonadota bacterium]